MANKKLLSEAIEAFINRDEEVAAKKLRAFFVESAQEINKKMEEDFDADSAADGEEDLSEDLNADPQQSFTEEVGFSLDEEKDEDADADTDAVDFSDDAGVDAVEAGDEFADAAGDDVAADADVEKPEGVEPEDWQSIKDAMSGLEALFAEIYNSQEEGVDVADQEADEADADAAGDDFDGVDFGAEKVGESFKLKNVPAVDKTEKGDVQKKAAGVPGNAKAAVAGVKPAMPANNTEKVNDKSFDNKDHEAVKVENNDNILKSDKDIQKPVKAPKNAAVSAKSQVPARK